jgi:hypothetical protein
MAKTPELAAVMWTRIAAWGWRWRATRVREHEEKVARLGFRVEI